MPPFSIADNKKPGTGKCSAGIDTEIEHVRLEYELKQGNLNIRYVVSQVSLNPVPVSKFDIPKSGYREMTYEESKKGRKGK